MSTSKSSEGSACNDKEVLAVLRKEASPFDTTEDDTPKSLFRRTLRFGTDHAPRMRKKNSTMFIET